MYGLGISSLKPPLAIQIFGCAPENTSLLVALGEEGMRWRRYAGNRASGCRLG